MVVNMAQKFTNTELEMINSKYTQTCTSFGVIGDDGDVAPRFIFQESLIIFVAILINFCNQPN